MPLLITLLIFISMALFIAVFAYPLVTRSAIKERLARLMPTEEQRPVLITPPKEWQMFLAGLGRKLRMNQDELFKYRDLLIAAGFRKESLYVFLGSKVLLAAALPAAYLFLIALPHGNLADRRTILLAIMCAIGGFMLPTIWLRRRVENRKTEIFHTLPDVLDLLTVSVEAGLNLDAALVKTAENFQHESNALIEEIQTVTLEMRAGKPRAEALKGLAERTMVDDLRSFVTMLVQTEKFGTSLGKTLRTYSDSMRTKRKQVAEEAGAKTAVKMLFPLTFFIFPALMVVILVPAFFRIMSFFNKH